MTDLPGDRAAQLGRWSERRRQRMWLLAVIAAATIPVAGAFTWSRAFLVRDLTYYFWPRYRWLRQTVWNGDWPWWDPFVAAGQATAGDALGQLFLLPTLALRLLLPEPVGFNLWVALPVPLVAWGTYAFFRRHASPSAAALGALLFALSGPVLSTLNFPNLSWSALFVPWLLWAADRSRAASVAWHGLVPVSLLFASQICAGEPLVTAVTAGLVLAYVATMPAEDRIGRRMSRAGRVALALGAGTALAGVQLVPLLWAVKDSARGVLEVNTDMWSVHPLALVETIAPQVFGNAFVAFLAVQPWIPALNSGRDPFFLSIYLGIGALLLALVGLAYPLCRRWSVFWMATGLIALIAALGSYTPLYPALLAAIPPLRVFRFPAKYLLFVTFAMAALATAGWGAVERRREEGTPQRLGASMTWALGLGAVCAVVAYASAMFRLAWPDPYVLGLYEIARLVALPDPAGGAEFLFGDAVAHSARLFLMSALGAGLLWLAWTSRPEARTARWVLFVLLIVDLVVTNRFVNPTAPLALVQEPSWIRIVRQHPHERFYFGGRFAGKLDFGDFDSPTDVLMPPADTLQDTRVLVGAHLVTVPSAFGIREMVSHDLPSLRPREYAQLMRMVQAAAPEQRRRFLARTGVRYCFGREPAPSGRPVLDRIPYLRGFVFFECNPDAVRAYVAETAGVLPTIEDQLKYLFKAEYDEQMVLLQAAPPPPAGVAGAPVAASARFLSDRPSQVEIEASADRDGGYLVLLDTYDPSWRVQVDGEPAPLLRANGLFRAVHLAPGRHRVTFTYVPTSLWYGAAVSGVGALGVLLMAWRRPRVQRVDAPTAVRISTDEPVLPI